MTYLFKGIELKVYKDPGSSFILCHNPESNIEEIHNLKPNGRFESGIHRKRFASGDTIIGSQYFHMGWRREDRVYRLFRFNDTGDIHYIDKISVYDSSWRNIARYSFNPETLVWTNMLDV